MDTLIGAKIFELHCAHSLKLSPQQTHTLTTSGHERRLAFKPTLGARVFGVTHFGHFVTVLLNVSTEFVHETCDDDDDDD